MTGIVIPFPTPLTAAVVQHPRRGRLPKGIGSIKQAAARRVSDALKARAKAEEDTQDVLNCCRGLEELAKSAKVTGVVVIACDQDGKRHSWWAGSLTREPIRAANLLSRTLPVILRQFPTQDT